MSGDDIRSLPMTPSRQAKPSELELVYSLFGNKENYPILQQVASPFRSAFVGAILFLIFSLPFVLGLTDKIFPNVIVSRIVLAIAFLIIFWILTRNSK